MTHLWVNGCAGSLLLKLDLLKLLFLHESELLLVLLVLFSGESYRTAHTREVRNNINYNNTSRCLRLFI